MVEALLSMVVLAIATTFTPGPSTLLAAASGARFGVRSTIPLMAGVAVGLASLMVAAAAGLMVLLQAVPSIHIVVKVLGSAYLLWLCWRISRITLAGDESGLLKSPVGFGAGIAVLLANPKAWSMAIAASATYAELVPNATQLALMLGAVFCRCRDIGDTVLVRRRRHAWQHIAQRQAVEDRQPHTRRPYCAVDNSVVAVTVGEGIAGASARVLLRPPSWVW
jgi:threonine/homoserine/homoserine lactone efflux protein